jgi:GNAT superfamily N-acetyltransferase
MTNVVVKTPSECSEEELDIFEALVMRGGEVTAVSLRGLLERAHRLIFLFEGNKTLAGIAALKAPNVGYKRKVFRKAGSEEDPDDFAFEAGWIYVEEQFRGRKYSRLLLAEILRLAGESRVYATTRETNEAMRRTNLRVGLEQSGHPYRSDEGEYNLVLYVGGRR